MDGLRGRDPLQRATNWSSLATGDASIEFGRFRVLLRQQRLLVDGIPAAPGALAFDLLLVLLEAGARSSQRRSFSIGCGRAVLCRKTTSRPRSPHRVKPLALTAS
jgi:hypothetical protein